ncbi:MAG: peptidyl-prolyl cis-trans isomerase [Deltaproteobacteria bacterium]|nr:peptidyl-prolyl cis-trans isomerase [Deltaproteobacteria bacterium]MBW2363063.1 peptidyl-prolyl cis-trans isomerase [Deltaproteobacteria bacterium]
MFVAQGLWTGPADAGRSAPVVVGAEQVAQLRQMAQRETGREPSARDLQYRIDAWIDDALLLREARAMGWHLSDPVVHMRLAQNLRFLGAEPDADDAVLVERAYELGMDRSDIVVRRRLLERMRLAITSAAVANEPSDSELNAILVADPERYRRAPLVKLTQVFVSRDRRGPHLERDAGSLLAELERDALPIAAAAERGDPSLIASDLPLSSERALAARLGPDFARVAIGLEPGGWHGPVSSSYGLHLVWVERRVEARDPDVAEARRELLATWRAETERAALRRALATLREGVEIRIEEAPTSG